MENKNEGVSAAATQQKGEGGEGNNNSGAAWDRVHPCLRGRTSNSDGDGHGFSASQMAALVAVCEAIFPILDRNPAHSIISNTKGSGSELPNPHVELALEVAWNIRRLLKKNQYRLLNLALFALSTRIGTLAIVGTKALSCWAFFPILVRDFASIPLAQRQECLWSLSQHRFHKYQELFKFFKSFVGWIAFSTVDRNGIHPFFNPGLLQYRVPLPPLPSLPPPADCCGVSQQRRPLDGYIIDAKDVWGTLGQDFLRKKGYDMLDDAESLRKLRRNNKSSSSVGEKDVAFECDVVVVGSGAGGAVVAARLAEAGFRVVILEKGSYFAREDLSLLEGPSMYAMYEESACLLSEDLSMFVLAGSTLGGGTTVNWSASFRTPAHVRREWATECELSLFVSPEYEKAMDAVCSRLGVRDEVEVAEAECESLQNCVLRRGCAKLGLHVGTIPQNNPVDHHCGFCGLGCRNGAKQSTAETWLVDAAAHGALIVTGCKVSEVLHTQNHGRKKNSRGAVACGVVASPVGGGSGNGNLYIKSRVVVAACGALQTPPLLLWSGLRNPNIGKHLHLHPVQIVWGYFPPDSPSSLKGLNYDGGIMTAYSKAMANWDTTGYGAMLECPAVHPGTFAIMTPWRSGADFRTRMHRFARTACFIVLIRDRSEGEVNTDAEGRLCVRFAANKEDRESIIQGTEVGLRAMAAAGAAELGTNNSACHVFKQGEGEGEKGQSERFEGFLRQERGSAFRNLSTNLKTAHQMGSCRMGRHPGTSAVDPSCQTWEVEGLFVADSSVFPTSLGVNPMITIQTIAYCTAQSIISHLSNTSIPQTDTL